MYTNDADTMGVIYGPPLRHRYRRYAIDPRRARLAANISRARRAAGLGAVDVTIDPTKAQPAWLKTISDLAQTGLSVFQAERLRKMQVDRINQGLPPLSDSQVRALAPTANVNVALPKELQYGMLAGGAALIYLLTRKGR